MIAGIASQPTVLEGENLRIERQRTQGFYRDGDKKGKQNPALFTSYKVEGNLHNEKQRFALQLTIPGTPLGGKLKTAVNLSSKHTAFVPETFRYMDDVGARATIATKVYKDMFGHEHVTPKTLEEDTDKLIDLIKDKESFYSGPYLAASDCDVMSSTLSQYSDANILNNKGEFDPPVRGQGSPMKDEAAQNADYGQINGEDGSGNYNGMRPRNESFGNYMRHGGFFAERMTNTPGEVWEFVKDGWAHATGTAGQEGIWLPSPSEINRMLSTPMRDVVKELNPQVRQRLQNAMGTAQKYLESADHDARVAFYTETELGRKMISDYLRVWDFAGHLNDFGFLNVSYKYQVSSPDDDGKMKTVNL